LGSNDEILLAAFASDGALPYDLTTYGNFTNNGEIYYSTLDNLTNLIGGCTPLYKAVHTYTYKTYTDGNNFNKAVVVFTDGEDTDGGYTVEDVINYANQKNVRIFTIGLSSGTNVKVLSDMALKTNGAFMRASNARQLISAFGYLGNLLHCAQYYRINFTSTLVDNNWSTGTWFSTSLRAESSNGVIYIPFHFTVSN